MKIYLNDIERAIDTETTLAELLQTLNVYGFKGTALAVNGQVVPATEWESTLVRDGDRILMIEAVQGG